MTKSWLKLPCVTGNPETLTPSWGGAANSRRVKTPNCSENNSFEDTPDSSIQHNTPFLHEGYKRGLQMGSTK